MLLGCFCSRHVDLSRLLGIRPLAGIFPTMGCNTLRTSNAALSPGHTADLYIISCSLFPVAFPLRFQKHHNGSYSGWPLFPVMCIVLVMLVQMIGFIFLLSFSPSCCHSTRQNTSASDTDSIFLNSSSRKKILFSVYNFKIHKL